MIYRGRGPDFFSRATKNRTSITARTIIAAIRLLTNKYYIVAAPKTRHAQQGQEFMTIGKGKRTRDPNQLAKWIVDRSTAEPVEEIKEIIVPDKPASPVDLLLFSHGKIDIFPDCGSFLSA
jgi:hypothetical protein